MAAISLGTSVGETTFSFAGVKLFGELENEVSSTQGRVIWKLLEGRSVDDSIEFGIS